MLDLPALSRSTVDRREPLRDDEERVRELWPSARVIVVDAAGRTPLGPDGVSLVYRSAPTVGEAPPADALLLGEQDGVAYWAVLASPDQVSEDWRDLRAIGALLDATDAGLLTTAVSLFNWHRHAGFCAVCGSRTESARSGWVRQCTGCGREEYPRTDAAVICLVHDGEGANGEHVLLARQPVWPPERYSVLAGFVEAGESLEACVEREVAEEVGVAVHAVRYLGSQPWPFPRSIMVGFAAIADRSAPLHAADGEIEDARWVHRSQVRAALDADGRIPGLWLPMHTSIAYQMLAGWAAAG
ncbi:NAD(+) diphosphatase [Solihabitans fulvus]|uniref:NAD(+) diphosphatase n=1 Tax=Solihabitans fulvus TaxID=1892852 RepID=A0A5B2XL62_9PSEU|nr:NAD(+) diphosphatase [Solihabitans fulvus]KAA2263855.1 NAD(+) diphosphatase [Solihabitans fulvus]